MDTSLSPSYLLSEDPFPYLVLLLLLYTKLHSSGNLLVLRTQQSFTWFCLYCHVYWFLFCDWFVTLWCSLVVCLVLDKFLYSYPAVSLPLYVSVLLSSKVFPGRSEACDHGLPLRDVACQYSDPFCGIWRRYLDLP